MIAFFAGWLTCGVVLVAGLAWWERRVPVYRLPARKVPRLAADLADLALAHRIGHIPIWEDYVSAVEGLLSEAPDLDQGSAS